MFNKIDSIFLDFDGTITKTDTVNSFFKTFASPKWIDIEQDWIDDKINSKTCMQMQLDLIQNLTEEAFYNFLNSIEIQNGFSKFCNIAAKNNKKVTILSDGFDFFIDYVLKKENIQNVQFLSNKLEISKENNFLKFKLSFPNSNKSCSLGLGTCKCAKATKDSEFFLYAGDGLSDRCIASKACLLFAKNSLKNHCIKNDIKFIEFNDFNDILDHLNL